MRPGVMRPVSSGRQKARLRSRSNLAVWYIWRTATAEHPMLTTLDLLLLAHLYGLRNQRWHSKK
jgi:hypothetical protein